MVTVAIVLGMLTSFVLGAYTGVKSVQMGLKFQVQIDKKQEPKMDEPIKAFFDNREEKKIKSVTNEMISDILGGE